MLRDHLVNLGLIKALDRVVQPWFQLEFLGEENLPTHAEGPRLLVMNHTAFFALEVYLLGARLMTRDPQLNLRTLVWGGFSEGAAGAWFRGLGCETASIAAGSRLLQEGKTVIIMPEGIGATDVRRPFNRFRTGYLQILKQQNVPIVPVGFYGVDESIPWRVLNQQLLIDKLMKPVDPSFDFLPVPRLPILRPTKIVFNIGKPMQLEAADFADAEALNAANDRVRTEVERLVTEARRHRDARIQASTLNRWFHRLVAGPNVRYQGLDR